MAMKSSPLDNSAFHQETSVNYLTFTSIVTKATTVEPMKSMLQPDKLTAAYYPISGATTTTTMT